MNHDNDATWIEWFCAGAIVIGFLAVVVVVVVFRGI